MLATSEAAVHPCGHYSAAIALNAARPVMSRNLRTPEPDDLLAATALANKAADRSEPAIRTLALWNTIRAVRRSLVAAIAQVSA